MTSAIDGSSKPNRDFIRVGRSRIDGRGVFAKRRIPRGTRIIEYVGERRTLSWLLENSDDHVDRTYLFRLNEQIIIDGSTNGNDARFINHGCDPNCEAYVFDDHLYIYAMRDIVRGEELTFDYQLSNPFRRARGKAAAMYACSCGSPNCRGSMLAPQKRARRKTG